SVPSNIGIGSVGILSGMVVSATTPGDYVITVTATDGIGNTGSVNYTLRVIQGTYYMPDYCPVVAKDEYVYAVTDGLDAVVPVRVRSYMAGLSNPIVVSGGETVLFYEHVIDNPAIPGVAVNLRASTRFVPRSSLRAQTAILYYRGVDSAGNIWEYSLDANGGVPYQIFSAWANPGQTTNFTINFTDGYTYAYSVKINDSLITAMDTPLATFNNVMKITYLVDVTDPLGEASTLNYNEYCVKSVGIIATEYYEEKTFTTLINKEILLSTLLGGGVTLSENNPYVVNVDQTVGTSFSFLLNAAGGSTLSRYVWGVDPLYSGTQLRIQSPETYYEGSLAPTTYNLNLTVTDHYLRSATKTIVMTVQR
ncbi:MAG: hypothetical protein PHD82_13680, partial [Candidatus Riflebacteria bacterium]|nr:hypothetical protein [Candidatus Riflebacteria bacterium]